MVRSELDTSDLLPSIPCILPNVIVEDPEKAQAEAFFFLSSLSDL